MNNDRPPASKLRKWLMGNKESTLPGLIVTNRQIILSMSSHIHSVSTILFGITIMLMSVRGTTVA